MEPYHKILEIWKINKLKLGSLSPMKSFCKGGNQVGFLFFVFVFLNFVM